MANNFFLNRRKKNDLKARSAQDIWDNIQPIKLEWADLHEETMPVLRDYCPEMEQAVRIHLAEANSADLERKRKLWEALHISL